MGRAWRFFLDAEGRWRWEQRGALAESAVQSKTSYDTLEQCQTAAKAMGYLFEPSQSGTRRLIPTRRL